MKNYIKQTKNNQQQWRMLFLCLFLCMSSAQLYAEERPILEMTLYSSKLLKPDLTPNFSIYADGSIDVYQPIYMKESGLFRGQLNEEQLNEVINIASSLEKFDSIAAEERFYEAEMAASLQSSQLKYSSETMVTIFKINNPEGLGSGETLIVAENVQAKSTRFQNLVDWKNIAAAENRLKTLASSLTLSRISDAE